MHINVEGAVQNGMMAAICETNIDFILSVVMQLSIISTS